MIYKRINSINEFIKNENFNDLSKNKNNFNFKNNIQLELFFNSINKNYEYTLKFIPIIENEISSELKIMHLLKNIVIKMKTPHIVLPINSRIFKIEEIINHYQEQEIILKKYQKKNNYQNLNILIC